MLLDGFTVPGAMLAPWAVEKAETSYDNKDINPIGSMVLESWLVRGIIPKWPNYSG